MHLTPAHLDYFLLQHVYALLLSSHLLLERVHLPLEIIVLQRALVNGRVVHIQYVTYIALTQQDLFFLLIILFLLRIHRIHMHLIEPIGDCPIVLYYGFLLTSSFEGSITASKAPLVTGSCHGCQLIRHLALSLLVGETYGEGRVPQTVTIMGRDLELLMSPALKVINDMNAVVECPPHIFKLVCLLVFYI